MGEIKNPFSFGTGDIDKDQWLRDIDNEQEEFISRYGSAANKHRTALLRQAFQDLRGRIASGDMLNRTADGLYQFGSALIRDDKHMQEAYLRALGFMGGLARRLINTPAPEPEKKKFTATALQDAYKKHLFPGLFNEQAYWDRDVLKRKDSLIEFLKGYQKDGAFDSYLDFGDFGTKEDLLARIAQTIQSLTNGEDMDYNLGRLGFLGNWINKPVEEAPKEEPKDDLTLALEQLLAAQRDTEALKIRLLLEQLNAPAPEDVRLFGFNPNDYWSVGAYEHNLEKYFDPIKEIGEDGKEYLKPGSILWADPNGLNALGQRTFHVGKSKARTSWYGEQAQQAMNYLSNQYAKDYNNKLDSYFRNFAVNYKSYLNDPTNRLDFMLNLAKMLTHLNSGDEVRFLGNTAFDKYMVKLQNGRYGFKGTNISYDPTNNAIYLTKNIGTFMEGGIIKATLGYKFDSSKFAKQQQQKTLASPDIQLSNALKTRLYAAYTDIASMLSAFIPGYGTAISAVTGVGSTLANAGADISDDLDGWTVAKNAGLGLAADVMGLIPGLGTVGKTGKIVRNIMWAVPKMTQWFSTILGLDNKDAIIKSFSKLPNTSQMTLEDWLNVHLGLAILTGHGRSGITKLKKAGMTKTYTTSPTEYYVNTNKGRQKVTKELFDKLKSIRGRSDRQKAAEETLGEGTFLHQTPWNPLNTTRFGGFRTVPGGTRVEVQNKHRGWFSDENIVQGVENLNPSVDFRKFATKANPYNAYYNRRNTKATSKEAPKETPKTAPEVTEDNGTLVMNPVTGTWVKRKEYGGILKALRNGGIIKAELGWNTTNWDWTSSNNKNEIQVPLDPNAPYSNLRQTINFGDATPTFFIDLNITKNKLDANRGQVLAGSREKYSVPYSGSLTLLNYKSAMNALLNYYKSDHGRNIMGDVYNYYNIWKLSNPNGDYTSFINNYNNHVRSIRDLHFKKFELDSNGNPVHKVNETGWEKFNQEHNSLYPSYGEYDKNKEQWLGESTWRRLPNSFDDDNDMKDLRNGFLKEGDNSSYIHMKNDGTLELVEAPKQNTNGVKEGQNKKQQVVVDSAGEIKTPMELKLKDPWDPTLATIAGKTLLGLRGNRDIYGNLLKEMPQAPLRDPIDRKLAIVGWQEQIKQGLNQLTDLRNIYGKLVGSDALVNLAGALEVEGKGRDIMNDKFMKDSERQFTTALRSWDLDNEDTLYNVKVGDDNRRAIADRARMMAQIRAAWRSGDNNILMGGFADASNWLLKRYQREQDIVDKARGIELGNPESRMQERLVTELGDLANKKPSEMTAAEIARVEAAKAKILRESNKTYASDYYNMFHTPGFGGGYYTTMAKDGTKLEVAKLKARSKDNDRYVSMIKDLRQSSRRRRRR